MLKLPARPEKTGAAHLRHRQIEDDQFGGLLLNDVERLDPVAGFQKLMTLRAENCSQQLAIHRVVVYNKNRRHQQPRAGPPACSRKDALDMRRSQLCINYGNIDLSIK